MALRVPTFLVRHGQYDTRPHEELTEDGVDQIAGAGCRLQNVHHIGERVLIMSSDRPCAVQSAEILSTALGATGLLTDERLGFYGERPQGLEDLDHLLEDIGLAEGTDVHAHDGLVVVSHAPLISIAYYHDLRPPSEYVTYGGVYPYDAGSWLPPGRLL